MIKPVFATLILVFCSFVFATNLHAQKAQLFDSIDLSGSNATPQIRLQPAANRRVAKNDLDAQVVKEINYLRRNPAAYAALLEDYKRYFVGRELRLPNQIPLLTREGAAVVDETIQFLKRVRPAQVLSDNDGLTSAALDHVLDIARNGDFGHYDSRHESPIERVNRYGVWGGELQELISYSSETARQIVFNLLIDDGVKSRGHRTALLNDNVRFAGIKTGDSRRYGKLCVVVLTASFWQNS